MQVELFDGQRSRATAMLLGAIYRQRLRQQRKPGKEQEALHGESWRWRLILIAGEP